jgi:hypothetical protein
LKKSIGQSELFHPRSNKKSRFQSASSNKNRTERVRGRSMDAGIVVGEYDMKTSKKSNKKALQMAAQVTKFSGNMTMD